MSLSLQQLLTQWKSGYVISLVSLPESKVVATARRIITNDSLKPPPAANIQKVKEVLATAVKINNFSSLVPLDWRYSPFALEGEDGLLAKPEMLERYLIALKDHARPRILRSLVAVYLTTFSVKNKSTNILASFLEEHVSSMGPLWSKAMREYSIFQPLTVLNKLAMLLTSQTGQGTPTMTSLFRAAEVPPLVDLSHMGLLTLEKAIQDISHNYQSIDSIDTAKRIMGLAVNEKGNLCFGGGSALVSIVSSALLLPFCHAKPSTELRSEMEAYLLHHLKDPRLHPAYWNSVPLEAKDVMLRWLTEQSLELFLEIVDSVVHNSEDAKRMWNNRKDLWRTYLKEGFIDQAWVVLGKDGENYACNINSRTVHSRLSYGKLISSTDIYKHTVLMMKIDSVIVVDWSHNGKCHIWSASHPSAPRFYKSSYTKMDLEHNSEIAFTHDIHGSWMQKVKFELFKRTNRIV